MILITKLLLAHFLGDFIFQPNSWIASKNLKKALSGKLYLHGLIHGGLAALFVWERQFIFYAAFLAVLHTFIDLLKVTIQRPHTSRKWFIYDQILHILVILLISFWWMPGIFDFRIDQRMWIMVTGSLFLTLPSSIIIKNLISVWTPIQNPNAHDLQDAGKYIGILERLFIFAFIITGHFEGVGFLLAAKSIFRFGDLTRSQDRKLTEYVMIGTLLSFGFSMLTAFLVSHLLILQ